MGGNAYGKVAFDSNVLREGSVFFIVIIALKSN